MLQKAESFLPWLLKKGPGYFAEMAEKIAFDRNEYIDPEQLDAVAMSELIHASCIQKRGVFSNSLANNNYVFQVKCVIFVYVSQLRRF